MLVFNIHFPYVFIVYASKMHESKMTCYLYNLNNQNLLQIIVSGPLLKSISKYFTMQCNYVTYNTISAKSHIQSLIMFNDISSTHVQFYIMYVEREEESHERFYVFNKIFMLVFYEIKTSEFTMRNPFVIYVII